MRNFVGLWGMCADSRLICFSYWDCFLKHIFDTKICDFFKKMIFFWLCDKSADSADINEKMLGKFCIECLDPNP